jgi:hypothetical protein
VTSEKLWFIGSIPLYKFIVLIMSGGVEIIYLYGIERREGGFVFGFLY